MIGKLKGVVEEISDDHIIVDVQGVGYIVRMTSRALATLQGPGQTVSLFIETQVREDAIRLFGFFSRSEQEWFRMLQSVQGVGTRVALSVLGTLSISTLADAIALHNIAIVTHAPGVGKKVAERIVTELGTKSPAYTSVVTEINQADTGKPGSTPLTDAISALCNLGYSRDLATGAVALAVQEAGEKADSARLIRLSLKELSK